MNRTITELYRKEQQELHIREDYGTASLAYAPLVRTILREARCSSLSDYGAGKGHLQRLVTDGIVSFDYRPFDPAFPEYGEPQPAELVACIDVLEHVEPELLNQCLDEIASITEKLVVLTIHTGPAKKRLSDGRNAHLVQRPLDWWLPKLVQRFDVIVFRPARKGFFVLACRKDRYAVLSREIDFHRLSRAAIDSAPPRISGLRQARLSLLRSFAAKKQEVGVLWLAARDDRTPWYVKSLAGFVAFCALSPIDLTPDFIPVIGYFDDAVLLLFGTFIAKRLIPPDVLADLRRRAASVDYRRAMHGAAVIGVLWLGAAIMAGVHRFGPAV